MQDKRFDRPVKILTGRFFSVARQLETTAQAATICSCMAALEGLTNPHVAREGFEAAAEEAEILVNQP